MGIFRLSKSTIFFTIFLFMCTASSMAQNGIISGTVRDTASGGTVPGVNIMVTPGVGSVTDPDGNYSFEAPPGNYTLKATYLGYDPYEIKITVKAGETLVVDFKIAEKNRMLDQVVVSGSRYGKNASEETISIEVLGPSVFKNTNSIDLADAVMKTPGVNVVDGQASIRGGTGFSYGAGSRVLILVDDMPMLSADMGGAYWKAMPMETAESIEILKGASSALYGSSALNGVINLRTGWAKPKPVTDVTFYSGITGTPREKYRKWWSDYSQPFFTGAFASHRQRIGTVDVVIGANYHYEKSYLEGNDQFRYRATFKTRYRPKKNPFISTGVNGGFMWERSGRFFLWQDGDTNSLRISDGSNDQYYFLNVDPYFEYADDKGNTHNLRTRYFRTYRYGSGSTANSISNLAYVDYQYRKVFKRLFTLTVGGTGNYGWMSSNLYEGSRFTVMGAGYTQLEFKYRRWNAVVGGRVEYNQVDTAYKSTVPVFRAGLNFKAAKYTFLRASWGQGYRVPTMVERFLDAGFAGVSIKPNPHLRAERGWNAEIAVKQGFGFSNFKGFFDFAAFWMENTDMVEYSFGYNNGFFFQPVNVDRARIAGFEGNITGQGKIGPVTLRTLFGYTYNFPVDMGRNPSYENAGKYIREMFGQFAKPNLPSDTLLLKYRNRHMVRLDLEADIYKFTLGTTMMYNSFMESFDDVLYVFDVDGYYAKRAPSKGDFILDLRLAYQMTSQAKVSFIVKNATNLGYSNRPGIMNSPISFSLQFRYLLDRNN
jgi:outer membrane receptor protein involved in Fe transport